MSEHDKYTVHYIKGYNSNTAHFNPYLVYSKSTVYRDEPLVWTPTACMPYWVQSTPTFFGIVFVLLSPVFIKITMIKASHMHTVNRGWRRERITLLRHCGKQEGTWDSAKIASKVDVVARQQYPQPFKTQWHVFNMKCSAGSYYLFVFFRGRTKHV